MAKHGFSGVRLPEFFHLGFASKNSEVVLLNLVCFLFCFVFIFKMVIITTTIIMHIVFVRVT